MIFRPCIDIHNGKVKQIVGGSLKDAGSFAKENFVSEKSAEEIALMFKEDNVKGAHVIMLNKRDSEYFDVTKEEAFSALYAYPNGLQIGGGITSLNAKSYIDAGAEKVIVTSYAFSDGEVKYENLEKLVSAVGRERIVLDLSCRFKDGEYYIVTDRWQNFTSVTVKPQVFDELSQYASEFLIHGVDVEGTRAGIDEKLITILSNASEKGHVITYAGGISSEDDIKRIEACSSGRLDFTVGSALDIYGGNLSYKELVEKYR